MMEKKDDPKYSVAEIDLMRRSVERLNTFFRQSFKPEERNRKIEEQLRTYMLNGTTPNELSNAADAHMEQENKRLDEEREQLHALCKQNGHKVYEPFGNFCQICGEIPQK